MWPTDCQLHFAKAVDASHRAVMADTDEASARGGARSGAGDTGRTGGRRTAAAAARRARASPTSVRALETFDARFTEYRRIDRDILPLAVENTNLKAQQLLFGRCTDAVSEIRTAVGALGQSQHAMSADRRDALAARTSAAVLEVQVVLARHIAEADEAAMTRMEERIHVLEAEADTAIASLGREASPEARAAARSALDRFKTVVEEITTLSRRNTNVRSLALALGRQRTITSQCDESLRQLATALSTHTFNATR